MEQYEESSDEDDEYDNKLARGVATTRQAAWTAYDTHRKGQFCL